MTRLRFVRSAAALLVGAIGFKFGFVERLDSDACTNTVGRSCVLGTAAPLRPAKRLSVQPPVRVPSTGLTSPVAQGIAGSPAAQNSAIASVLEQGRTLESQRRWAEAFALYEDTVRQNYGQSQPELEQRLDVAKMHFDIGRRYADCRLPPQTPRR